VFLKGLEELYACDAVILFQLFSYDAMLGRMCILEFSNGSIDLYAHKAET
jgi:hypothetical protein